jgi:four helix bundle protein
MDQLDFLLEDGEKPFGIKHRCFYFSKDVVLFVKDCKYDRVFTSLFDQLVRSATSIGANLIEGRSGSSKKDWVNFATISLKSANETKYWLCLIRDTLDVDKEKINGLIKEAIEISNIIATIIINAKKSKM